MNGRSTWRIIYVQIYIDPDKYTYSLVQAARYCFKEYIKTMTLKVGLKTCNTDPCILWRVNKLETVIVIVYVYDTLENG